MQKTYMLQINDTTTKEQTEKAITFDGYENSLWKKIGQELLTAPVPSTMIVKDPETNRSALFSIAQRGTWKDQKGTHPSMFVSEEANDLRPLGRKVYRKVRLNCIHPESNNYKAYIMYPEAGGIVAEYGSIDEVDKGKAKRVKDPYPTYMYWIRYYEKLSKGYVDQTRFYRQTPVNNSAGKAKLAADPKSANALLYNQLMSYTKRAVEKVLSSPFTITAAQVKECRKLWNQLGEKKTVKGFNSQLSKLMLLSPRKRNPLQDQIKDQLATASTDFSSIIKREEDLLLQMEAMVGVTRDSDTSQMSFRDKGIHVWVATPEQKKEVMDLLEPSLQGKVKQIYRVKPEKQEKAFADYCKTNHIKKIMKLWHGSGNENWASIIQNSLLLNPNAQITGKMFGKGIYFAPSAHKSWNYTSCRGTYWRHGTQSNGFMGLYATAYGEPLLATGARHYTADELKRLGKNCVHAEAARTGLRADEIIFYDENAICLNYIVEFAA